MKHEISELLPFYANGTLDDGDRRRVEDELATCTTCADELREFEVLAGALQTRAAAAPPVPPRVIDAAFARINTTPVVAASTRLHTAWWGLPVRYATAAALVVGMGAVGFAAWHAREGAVSSNTEAVAVVKQSSVYRVSPPPGGAMRSKGQIAGAKRADSPTTGEPAAADAVPPATVAKQHRLSKKARLELIVRDVEASLARAQSTVRAAGGDVTSLADTNPHSTDSVHDATLTVEVPAGRLDDTLDRLAQLGTVQTRAIDAEDLDASIVDQEARLRNLRRAEGDLRKLMDRGGKVDEILTVQQNLSEVRGQIEQLDAQHQADLHRVATSTITIALSEDRPNPTSAKPGPTARIDGAWHSGLNALSDSLVAVISTIAWCVAYSPVPLGLAAAAYTATRLFGRRRATAP